MKLSFYNHEENNGDNYILYNCQSDELIFLNEDLRDIWIAHSASNVDEIEKVHPVFFDYLTKKGFVVPESLDEQADFLTKLKNEDNREDSFSIIVNPTLDCNMRCWYCYEKHIANSYMSKEVMDNILKLAKAKVANPKLKTLVISLFGGEPLLAFDECVFPLLLELDSLCIRANKSFVVSFTSNSFLVNEDIISKLSTLHLSQPINWQITLDGGRKVHNKTRHTDTSHNTYDTIIKNIHTILSAHMNVLVRLNYRSKSILSFLDVIDSFRDIAPKYKNKLHFCFQQIWQDICQNSDAESFNKEFLNVKKAFEEAGLALKSNVDVPMRCYADKPNCVVVNYDGKIFKCTAQDFRKELSEGVLDKNGVINYNTIYHERMSSKYANKTCLSCKIYPLCFGGCSQKLLNNHDKCSRNLDNNGITEVIRQRILFLTGNINKQK